MLHTAVILAASFAMALGVARAQETIDVDFSQHKFLGTINCENCHTEPLPRYDSAGVTDRLLLTEWSTWNRLDKHSEAYRVLTDERGRRMAELLGQDVLAEATGCVQCHASNADDSLWSRDAAGEQPISYAAEGVGCEACHGPSSEWLGPHVQPSWRRLSEEQKVAEGFRPIRNPVFRGELCLSCHIGSPAMNRVITHEMYAAGHPPLSGYELESFADKLPRHWRYAYEKPGGENSEFVRTKNLLLASVVGLRVAVDLAAYDAQRDGGAHWPELARLECYSCHHELREPSWRQQVSQPLVGRPRLETACEPLVRVAATLAGGETTAAECDALFAQIHLVCAEKVFGDPAAIVALAPDVTAWCRRVEAELAAKRFDGDLAIDALAAIHTAATSELYDYDTARQLTGAIVVVCDELAALDTELQPNARLAETLRKLRESFNLHVDGRERVEETLPQSLLSRAAYQPQAFARLLAALDKLEEK